MQEYIPWTRLGKDEKPSETMFWMLIQAMDGELQFSPQFDIFWNQINVNFPANLPFCTKLTGIRRSSGPPLH